MLYEIDKKLPNRYAPILAVDYEIALDIVFNHAASLRSLVMELRETNPELSKELIYDYLANFWTIKYRDSYMRKELRLAKVDTLTRDRMRTVCYALTDTPHKEYRIK